MNPNFQSADVTRPEAVHECLIGLLCDLCDFKGLIEILCYFGTDVGRNPACLLLGYLIHIILDCI